MGYQFITTTRTKVFLEYYDDKRLEDMTQANGKHFRIIENRGRDTTTWQLRLFYDIFADLWDVIYPKTRTNFLWMFFFEISQPEKAYTTFSKFVSLEFVKSPCMTLIRLNVVITAIFDLFKPAVQQNPLSQLELAAGHKTPSYLPLLIFKGKRRNSEPNVDGSLGTRRINCVCFSLLPQAFLWGEYTAWTVRFCI